MTEEALIKLGVDARAVTRALQGVKNDFLEMKRDLTRMNVFGGILGKFGGVGGIAAIGTAAMAGMAKAAMDLAGRLQDTSDATGLSVETLQAWSRLVAEGGGNAKDADRAIAKFVSSLQKQGKTADEAEGEFSKLLDQVKAAESPMEQLAIATDIFGEKLGVRVVNALKQGNEGLEAMRKGLVLTIAEARHLDAIGDKLSHGWTTLKVGFGKILANVFSTRDLGTVDMLAKLDAQNAAAMAGNAPKPPSKETLEAAEKLFRAERDLLYEQRTEAQKVDFLKREIVELEKEEERAADGTAKKFDLKRQLLEKHKDLHEQAEKAQKLEQDFAKKKQEDQEKLNRQKEKELEIVESINNEARDLSSKRKDFESGLADQTRFTMEELAGMNIDRWTTSQMRGQIIDARRIRQARGRAGWLAQHGYEDQAQKILGEVDKYRAGMTALKESERFPYTQMLEGINDQRDSLRKLLRKAENEGMRVELANVEIE